LFSVLDEGGLAVDFLAEEGDGMCVFPEFVALLVEVREPGPETLGLLLPIQELEPEAVDFLRLAKCL